MLVYLLPAIAIVIVVNDVVETNKVEQHYHQHCHERGFVSSHF